MIVFHIILQKISANIELEVHNRGKKISLREKKERRYYNSGSAIS